MLAVYSIMNNICVAAVALMVSICHPVPRLFASFSAFARVRSNTNPETGFTSAMEHSLSLLKSTEYASPCSVRRVSYLIYSESDVSYEDPSYAPIRIYGTSLPDSLINAG